MLTLQCFGEVVVIDGNGIRVTLRSRKHLALLTYLVATGNTRHSRDELAWLLWGGEPKRARHSLSQALYDIKSKFGPALVADVDSVRLVHGVFAYELDRFEELLKAKDYEGALRLRRGDYAPNLASIRAEMFDRWMDGERERSRVLVTMALRNAQQAAEARGDWDQVCLVALQLTRLSEFDDAAHGALMRGLSMKGDPASALEHFKQVREREPDTPWTRAADVAAQIENDSFGAPKVGSAPLWAGMIGRKAAFGRLLEQHQRAAARTQVILVVGGSGLGKSTLTLEFARAMRLRGTPVGWVGGEDPDQALADVAENALRWRRQSVGANSGSPLLIADFNDPVRSGMVAQAAPPGTTVLATARHAPPEEIIEFQGFPTRSVRLGPLSFTHSRRLARRRLGRDARAVASLVAEYSGGVPAVAARLGDAIRKLPAAAKPSPRDFTGEFVRALVRGSHTLRCLADDMQEGLTETERRTLENLAMLTPAGLKVVPPLWRGEQEKAAYRRLVRLGLVRSRQGATEMPVRFLACAVVAFSGWKARHACHLDAARLLVNGSVPQRVAAAHELAAAGDREAARRCAVQAAAEAAVHAEMQVSAGAFQLAFQMAKAPNQRCEAGLGAAEASLAMGEYGTARRALRQIAVSKDFPGDEARVKLALARAQLHEAAPQHTTELLRDCKDGIPQIKNRAARAGARIRAETVRLGLARSESRGQGAAQKLERLLTKTSPDRIWIREKWVDGLGELIHFRARFTSAEHAGATLRRHHAMLDQLPSPAVTVKDLWKASLEYRFGRLRAADEIMTRLHQGDALPGSRYQGEVLSLAGFLRMELGELNRAGTLLGQACDILDRRAERAPEAVGARLNLAMCELFRHRHQQAVRHAEMALRQSGPPGRQAARRTAAAISGIAALRPGRDLEPALRARKVLSDQKVPAGFALGEFLVLWFRACCRRQFDKNPKLTDLSRRAGELEKFDAIGAHKARFVLESLGAADCRRTAKSAGLPAREARPDFDTGRSPAHKLHKAGISWFIRYALSWFAAARIPVSVPGGLSQYAA